MLLKARSVKIAEAAGALNLRFMLLDAFLAPSTPVIHVLGTRPPHTMRNVVRSVEMGSTVLAFDSVAFRYFAVAVRALD